MITFYLERILPSRTNLRFSFPGLTNRAYLQQALDRVTLSAPNAALCETETKSGEVIPSFLGHFGKKNTEKPQIKEVKSPVISEPPTQKPDKNPSISPSEIYYQSAVPVPASYKY